jgi:hypothetical protein
LSKKHVALLWLSALILAAPATGSLRAAKYPPGIRWREIHNGRFSIIFPAGREGSAAAALAAAMALNEELAAFWRFRLPGRTRIVLNDSTDDANGFATFFPYGLVGADLAEPPPDSELAGSGALLDLVLAHELTHLFTMNAGSRPFRKLRGFFGSLPALYPAIQLPPWAIEGLAVEGESRLTGDGRLNHPPYRLMLAAARGDGLFPSWSALAGMPAAWPGANGKYLFGAGFMEFLAGKYGGEGLRRYVERATSRLLTFSTNRDFEKAFGEPLETLWGEYRATIPAPNRPGSEPLTGNGFFQQYPRLKGEDGLLFYRRDYQSRGEVVLLDLQSGRDETLFRMDAVNGLSLADDGKKLLLSAIDYYHAAAVFSDIYEFDLRKRRLRRLSRGQRLSQPTATGNSAAIHCVQRRENRFHLAAFDPVTGKARALSRPFLGMAQPAGSPDGNLVAAAVKPEGQPWSIAIFTLSGEAQRFIGVQDADLSQPRWLNDRELLFIVSGKENSRLASVSLADGSAAICEDPRLEGLRQFDLAAGGRRVVFTFFSGRGQEIGRLNLENIRFHPFEISVTSGIPAASPVLTEPPPPSSRSYRPWRDLLPRWWSPALRAGGDELQAGIATSGQDALGIHSYGLEGYYGLSSRRRNWLFSYAYDGMFPTLSVSYRDSTDFHRDRDASWRSRELKLASLWPLRLRRRSQLYAYADLHLERRATIDDWGAYENTGSFNGFRLGLDLNSTREYYDSVSPSDGTRVALQCTIHPAGFGNQWSSRSVQADLRHYIPLFRPGVLAWRLAWARSWDSGDGACDMGGHEIGNGLGSSHPFRLLRGFDLGSFRGDRGWQFNLEYRLPLFRVETALLPAVSLDRVWLNVFLDSGRLSGSHYSSPTAYAAGAEAVLRLAVGGAGYTDLAFGAAYGFGPSRQWRFFLRSGRSF